MSFRCVLKAVALILRAAQLAAVAPAAGLSVRGRSTMRSTAAMATARRGAVLSALRAKARNISPGQLGGQGNSRESTGVPAFCRAFNALQGTSGKLPQRHRRWAVTAHPEPIPI